MGHEVYLGHVVYLKYRSALKKTTKTSPLLIVGKNALASFVIVALNIDLFIIWVI